MASPHRTGELTDRLLHAAADLFAEMGYEKAGVAEIARRAGVTTGAIYSRYGGKAELLCEAVDHHVPDSLDNVLNGAASSAPGDRLPATKVLSTLGDHLLDDLDGGHGLFLEAVVAARRDPDLADRLRERMAEEDRRLGKLIDEGTGAGLFDPDLDELAVVRLAHAIGLGMLLTRSLGMDLPDPDSWHKVLDRIIDSLGIDSPGGSSPTSGQPPSQIPNQQIQKTATP
ncbi:MAG TPA: hypothetical protein DGF10_00160 [Acidimicrobiaceae bacterium]|nr:hypothetical protein [Acidimicrobiaceae bacterium]HAQ24291.1 hypothetical protein [Acidimicrobiaceae bacterium]HCV33050.1 hypothetical protein [Acidimicrobiaceae bacterium]